MNCKECYAESGEPVYGVPDWNGNEQVEMSPESTVGTVSDTARTETTAWTKIHM